MKTKLFFPVLCALLLCFVACDKKNEPNAPNTPTPDEEIKAPDLNNQVAIRTNINGGEYQVQLSSSISWKATSDQKWVTVSPESGKGDTTVYIKVEPGLESESAKITFVNDAGSTTLLITRIVKGTANGGFSVAANKQVKFADGNLQYQANTKTWRFAKHQYDIIGYDNRYVSNTNSGWIDLFGWGTGDNPTIISSSTDAEYSTFTDWGKKVIGTYTWRTLSSAEWVYLFEKRPNAELLYGYATIDDQHGLVVIPDNTLLPVAFKAGKNYGDNTYSLADWEKLESVGALFLPTTGWRRSNATVDEVNTEGYYWSGTPTPDKVDLANCLNFSTFQFTPSYKMYRNLGLAVRLVRDL